MKVTKAFDGVPDGAVHPQRFNLGDLVHGDLALVALANKWAVEEEDEADKPIRKMNLDELKAYASSKGYDLASATKKDDVLAAVLKAEEQAQLDAMTEDELKAYATEKKIDVSAATDLDAIRAAVKAAAGS